MPQKEKNPGKCCVQLCFRILSTSFNSVSLFSVRRYSSVSISVGEISDAWECRDRWGWVRGRAGCQSGSTGGPRERTVPFPASSARGRSTERLHTKMAGRSVMAYEMTRAGHFRQKFRSNDLLSNRLCLGHRTSNRPLGYRTIDYRTQGTENIGVSIIGIRKRFIDAQLWRLRTVGKLLGLTSKVCEQEVVGNELAKRHSVRSQKFVNIWSRCVLKIYKYIETFWRDYAIV